MQLAIITLALLTGVASYLIMKGHGRVYSGGPLAPMHPRPTSPLDEAERILAARYARGELTADEYDRMLSILRR